MASSSLPLLDFKSATLYAVRLVLQSADTSALLPELKKRLQEAGDFFDGQPVVIDAQALSRACDWKALVRTLTGSNMPVVGIAAADSLHNSIHKAGLAVVSLPTVRETPAAGSVHRDPNGQSAQAASPADAAGATAPQTAPAAAQLLEQTGVADTAPVTLVASDGDGPRPALILDRPLRSGQKVYARDADLIVVGMVSRGAEVLADGNIHVYGPLLGKAMAGASGDESARIFTTQLDAELVSVAGVYRVVDAPLPAEILRRPAEVRLNGGILSIESLAV